MTIQLGPEPFNLFKDEKLMQAAGECTNSKETYQDIFCSQYQERENRCEGWQSGYTKNDNCAITCEGSCGSDLSLGKIIVIGIICLILLFIFVRCCCTKKVPSSTQTATEYVRSNPTRSFWSSWAPVYALKINILFKMNFSIINLVSQRMIGWNVFNKTSP